MKIGSIDTKPAPPVVPSERKSAPTGSAPAEASAQVELSQAASTVTAGEGDGSFDSAKVERIAQAIRDGKFTINAEAIADKLIVNAQELLAKKLPN